MNRKQRRAHARHTKSSKAQSRDSGVPLRNRGLEATLSASADHDDHAEFRAMVQPTLEASHPAADDRAHAQRLVERASVPDQDPLPPWLHGLTQARAVKAMEYGDLWWDFSF